MADRWRARREDGAVLVLALVFMIVIALVLLGVVTLSGNDLLNTSHLLDQQSLEYSSSGGMQRRHTNGALHQHRLLHSAALASRPTPPS